jgi:hypothetical protein
VRAETLRRSDGVRVVNTYTEWSYSDEQIGFMILQFVLVMGYDIVTADDTGVLQRKYLSDKFVSYRHYRRVK